MAMMQLFGYMFLFLIIFLITFLVREIVIPICKVLKDMDASKLNSIVTEDNVRYLIDPQSRFAAKMIFDCHGYKFYNLKFMIYDSYFKAKELILNAREKAYER